MMMNLARASAVPPQPSGGPALNGTDSMQPAISRSVVPEAPAMMNCKSCGRDKPEAVMFRRNGKPIRTCKECKAEQFKLGIATRAKTMQSMEVSRSERVDISGPPPAAPVVYPVLEILPGWGVNAAIDD